MSTTAPAQSADVRDAIRATGLRATASRIAVLALLQSAERPLSHHDVVVALDGRGWDQATLYRNLIDLTEAGLLRPAGVGGRVARFEAALATAHNLRAHAHFVCTSCGELACLPEVAVVVTDAPRLPASVRNSAFELQLRGRCDQCN
jgi:Fur family ferric uptake transcriptional regulator